MGPAGVTIVVAREDLISKETQFDICPIMCDWEIAMKNDSMYNTPPCFSIYMCGLYFDYIK